MSDIIQNLCQCRVDCISLFIAFLTLIATIWIPHKIKWEQLYQQLLSEYRSHDFGVAIMEIGMFFHDDCNNDVSNIPEKYAERFRHDFYEDKKNTAKEHNLHYQRRLLTQFYYQLDLCAKSFSIGKKRIQRDFSSKESDLLKIVFYMNETSGSPEIFIDIKTYDRIGNVKKGINTYIKHIYSILKQSPNYVR